MGGHFALNWCDHTDEPIINLDKLTYASQLSALSGLKNHRSHVLVQGDICDSALVASLLLQYQPRAVIHFAAESHVDRSIHQPSDFIASNIVGTFQLLESVRAYWSNQSDTQQKNFRFLHVSTDEVYGSLATTEMAFTESNRYAPNNPYSASKAASDHLVNAWSVTYGLPTLTSHCCNNYGPHQLPEKLIPMAITNALAGKEIPIYGDGLQSRDWLYVGDHCEAIATILAKGQPGQTYNVGADTQLRNIDLVTTLCQILDDLHPRPDKTSYRSQITYINDRPGHDRRYAINSHKLRTQLGWQPKEDFAIGIKKTVGWYLKQHCRDV